MKIVHSSENAKGQQGNPIIVEGNIVIDTDPKERSERFTYDFKVPSRWKLDGKMGGDGTETNLIQYHIQNRIWTPEQITEEMIITVKGHPEITGLTVYLQNDPNMKFVVWAHPQTDFESKMLLTKDEVAYLASRNLLMFLGSNYSSVQPEGARTHDAKDGDRNFDGYEIDVPLDYASDPDLFDFYFSQSNIGYRLVYRPGIETLYSDEYVYPSRTTQLPPPGNIFGKPVYDPKYLELTANLVEEVKELLTTPKLDKGLVAEVEVLGNRVEIAIRDFSGELMNPENATAEIQEGKIILIF